MPVGVSPKERDMKMILELEHFSHEDRLSLFSLKKRRLEGDLVAAFQYLNGSTGKLGRTLIARDFCDRTGGHGFKLREDGFSLDIRKKFPAIRVVRH